MKIKNTLLAAFAFLLPGLATAQFTYMKSLESGDTVTVIDQLIKIFETNDNNLLIYGNYQQSASHTSFDIVKTDTAANPLWSTRITRTILPNENVELFRDIVQLPDSGYVMVGQYWYPFTRTIGFMRIDKNGIPVLGKEINGFTNSITAKKVFLFNDSTLLITAEGYSTPTAHGVSGHLFTDLNGNVRSSQLYHYNNWAVAGVVSLTADGGFINVFPQTVNPAGGGFLSTMGVMKYDANGVLQWNKNYINNNAKVYINDIKQLSNGNYVACGMVTPFSGSSTEGFVICLSQNGSIVWSKKHILFNSFNYNTIEIIGNDTIALAGSAYTPVTRELVTLVDSGGSFISSTAFLTSQPYIITESCLTHDNKYVTLTVTGYGNAIDKKIITKSDVSYLNLCNSNLLTMTDLNMAFYDSIPVAFHTETFFTTNITTNYVNDYTLPAMQVMCTATGLESLEENNFVRIFPNPARNYVNINLSSPSAGSVVSVFDLTGRELLTKKFNSEKQMQIQVNNLAKGIYILTIKSETKNYSKKLMVD